MACQDRCMLCWFGLERLIAFATTAQPSARNAEPWRTEFWHRWRLNFSPMMPVPTTPVRVSNWSTSLRAARDLLVSLKLTIVLLVFSMVLVFAGTLDQVNLGIW